MTPRGDRSARQHLAVDRDRQRRFGRDAQRLAVEVAGVLMAGFVPDEARRPVLDQPPLHVPDHRLHHDLTRIDRRGVDHLGAAVIGPVGDAHLDHAQLVLAGGIGDDQRERLEPHELIRRPAQIADAAEHPLQIVRHCLGDLRADAHRCAIGEIVGVDHAQVDPPRLRSSPDRRDPRPRAHRPCRAGRSSPRRHARRASDPCATSR